MASSLTCRSPTSTFAGTTFTQRSRSWSPTYGTSNSTGSGPFAARKHAGWFREYFPFLTVGILAQIVGLGILTLLMHPDSIFSLPPTIFDDSTGFRTRFYWAQLITIAIVTPISFLLNKFWTFSSVRGQNRATEQAPENVDSEHPTAGV
jgi:hypothetical protein